MYALLCIMRKLLSGSDEMASLFGVLIRFREGSICVTGDIKEMFHQVKIRREDQDAQRILWRNGEINKSPDTYVMQVMTFGATCSPSCAQVVKNRNASEQRDEYPLAYEPIVKQHYVDDYLDSFFTMKEAIETTDQVIKVHQKGGFFIRGFTSNRKQLLNSISEDRVQSNLSVVEFNEKDSVVEKILGVQWNTVTDTFGYKVKLPEMDEIGTITKRELLSFVMSVFDPLGLGILGSTAEPARAGSVLESDRTRTKPTASRAGDPLAAP